MTPLDPPVEPITDIDPPDPAASRLYAHVKRRADDDWGVQIRGENHQVVWTNGEGWTELGHALVMIRRSFGGIDIEIETQPDGRLTIIGGEERLPGAD